MYKIYYRNNLLSRKINLQKNNINKMTGGNHPSIKSLKDLNLFPKGTLESKLLDPTIGYEWSKNTFRNYFFFGERDSPITYLTKKYYHELGDGIVDPIKLILDNKDILRKFIGQYLGFYFFYFTNKEDMDRLIKLGDKYYNYNLWPIAERDNIKKSIKNILKKIKGNTFDERISIYKIEDHKLLKDEYRDVIDKYLKFNYNSTITVSSDSESSESDSESESYELEKKIIKKIKKMSRQIFKMTTSTKPGPEYNEKQSEGIFSIVLAVLWEIADDKSGIKEYYEGLNEYISVDIPSDFEDIEYTADQLEDYNADISDYNYTLAYLHGKLNSILTIQQQEYPNFTLDDGTKISYADCGGISLKNFIKILCFNGEIFDITLLSSLQPIDDIITFFRIFNTDELHSSNKKKKITFTDGYSSEMNARNAWAYLVSNREGVRYLKVTNGFKYEINQGTVDGKPNMLILLRQLFKKENLQWTDLDNSINVHLNSGIGHILFKDNSYKWSFMRGHYQTDRVSRQYSFNQDLWNVDDEEKEKLNYLYSIINIDESFNKKLFYYYNWKEKEQLLKYFNNLIDNTLIQLIKVCNGNISNIDLEYTRIFFYIYEKFNLDQKRRTNLDLSKLDIDDYIFNIDPFTIVKYGINWFDTSLQSLEFRGKQHLGNSLYNLTSLQSLTFDKIFDQSLGDSLDKLTSLQSLTFGQSFNQPLDKSLDNLTSLETLTLGKSFNQPLGESLDNLTNLQSLTLRDDFNQDLGESLYKLKSLQSLTLGYKFIYPLGASLDNLTNLQSLTFGVSFNQSLDNSLDKLTKLESLTFGNRFRQFFGTSLNNLTSLKSLKFGYDYNLDLGESLYKLTSLQSLTFGRLFNKPLGKSLDNLTNLRTLIIGSYFNQTLGKSLDNLISLETLTFGTFFKKPLGNSLDNLTNLQSLNFGYDYNLDLGESLYKLTSLQSLTFGNSFNLPLNESLDNLTSLQSLTLGDDFNQPLGKSLDKLTSLETLTFGTHFKKPLGNNLDNLTNLQSLNFGYDYNLDLGESLYKLTSLQSLTFGRIFNKPLGNSLDNLTNLQSLTFGNSFNLPLNESLNLLTNLETLTFGYRFNQPLGNSLDNLTNLQSLTFGNSFNLPLNESLNKLTNLETLTFGYDYNKPLGKSLDNLKSLQSLTFRRIFNQPLGKSLNNLTGLKSLTLGGNYKYLLKKNPNITVHFM